MCHAIVMIFIMGLKGPDNMMDLQFIDACPKPEPVACWLQFVEKRSASDDALIYHGICVDDKKHKVYDGRLAPMVET